jgi:WD40 repeat protein
MKQTMLVILICICFCATAQKNIPKANGLWTAAWSHDDKYFAFGGDDSILYIYSASTYELYRSYKLKSMIRGVSWHPKQNVLAVANMKEVQLLDLENNSVKTINGVPGGRGIDWNYNGELLGLADGYGVVQIINKEGKLIRSIKKHNNNSYLSLDWHPSKNMLVTSSDEIILFDTSGKQLKFINHRKDPTGVLTVQFHPSGNFFASGDYGHDVVKTLLQFWNEEGKLLKEIKGSNAEYRNIRWNKTGSLLATASDGLRIWNVSGKLLHHAKTANLLWGLDWNHAGTKILTVSYNGDVLMYSDKGIFLKRIK